ncbi:hypothetical protein HQ325_10820 [Rhodococcus sp. BP-349]|uniref:alpha/beta hydrolase n=1 Tax=unclassified Rhodococcus (in: high G+C Gram-positive bacteria) TaxID=192944 RepID=UPI001C9A56DB|nr:MULTISPECIES: alpha/beta hydrolase [unclassified Rhodococcus (in: high G+C Gram-positive bacteria)]MBY6539165.1 hypothetical protein [Rhodococcus sp. BP-363]MBY6544507.1 hypothetical protein [Rhodococcus sp. BP-369]MBY6563737.1 hypothetical protein [Rhodococcus sp. BP-370]MBY6578029.1 hypothetical protein [Rhodococcus sp. BP-364]MBY6587330.1 hypothetical protein [Rhodococcus sp. BP-358]
MSESVVWTAPDMWSMHTRLVSTRTRLRVLIDRVAAAGPLQGWEGPAADAARSVLGGTVADLSTRADVLGRIADVLARAGDDRSALSRWDPADRTGALVELDRTVAEDLTRAGGDESAGPAPTRAAAVLDTVDRARMAEDRERLVVAERDLSARLDDTAFGGAFSNLDAGLAETRQRLADLDALIEVLARPERRLVHYEAGSRRTLAAVSVGDLDGADRVAVMVPGAGTTVEASVARHDGETAALVAEAGALAPGSVTAGVSWLGYEAPQWNTELIEPGRSVASTAPAAVGASALVDVLDALGDRRHGDPAPEVTVVAHSYGTVVAAQAIAAGAPVDAVVVMGSPGWSDRAAAAAPGPVHVAEAAWDPVADLGWFGPDPSERPETEALDTAGTVGHADYLEPGSVSARAVAEVVAGRPSPPAARTVDLADVARFVLGML